MKYTIKQIIVDLNNLQETIVSKPNREGRYMVEAIFPCAIKYCVRENNKVKTLTSVFHIKASIFGGLKEENFGVVYQTSAHWIEPLRNAIESCLFENSPKKIFDNFPNSPIDLSSVLYNNAKSTVKWGEESNNSKYILPYSAVAEFNSNQFIWG